MITVGMNYEVKEGQGQPFEDLFKVVVQEMSAFGGHKCSRLLRDVSDPHSYIILSEWTSEDDFNSFIESDRFRKVTAWGSGIALRTRPKHEIYRSDTVQSNSEHSKCPMHALKTGNQH